MTIISKRHRPPLNSHNRWPSNGFFTQSRDINAILNRQWHHIRVRDLPLIIGNCFEQTTYSTIAFKIVPVSGQYATHDLLIDVRIMTMAHTVLPIECRELQAFEAYLRDRLEELSKDNTRHSLFIHCYMKGWFW